MKVVDRHVLLIPDKDSDGMTCAGRAKGSETVSVCYEVNKSYRNGTKRSQRQLEQSDQVI